MGAIFDRLVTSGKEPGHVDVWGLIVAGREETKWTDPEIYTQHHVEASPSKCVTKD